MPLLEQDQVIKQYYNQVKEKYSNFNFNDFELICKTPFEFTKKIIRDDSFPIMMIQYLGKFHPAQGLIHRIIKVVEKRIKRNILSSPIFDDVVKEDQDRIEFLRKYLAELKIYERKHLNRGRSEFGPREDDDDNDDDDININDNEETTYQSEDNLE